MNGNIILFPIATGFLLSFVPFTEGCRTATDCNHRCSANRRLTHCIDGLCCCDTLANCALKYHNLMTTSAPSTHTVSFAKCSHASECGYLSRVCHNDHKPHCVDNTCCCYSQNEGCSHISMVNASNFHYQLGTTTPTTPQSTTTRATGCQSFHDCGYLHGTCPRVHHPHCVDNTCCCYNQQLGCSTHQNVFINSTVSKTERPVISSTTTSQGSPSTVISSRSTTRPTTTQKTTITTTQKTTTTTTSMPTTTKSTTKIWISVPPTDLS